MQRDSTGYSENQTLATRKIDGVDAPFESGSGRRKPNLFPVWGPCQSFLCFPVGGENFLASCKIDYRNGATVVRVDRVVEKCDLVALRRDPRVADPARSFVQNMAQGKFQTLFAGHFAHNGEHLPIR